MFSMGMNCRMDIDIQHGTFSMDKDVQHGHGHPEWTRTGSMGIDMQHRYRNAAWTLA
jgi:hypothetical protein